MTSALAVDVCQEIKNVLYGYAELMDAGNFTAIGALLADATVSVEGSDDVVSGAEAITAKYGQWTQLYPNGTPNTKHVITNVIVLPDRDLETAQTRSYFMVLQAAEGVLPLQPILAGRYRHSFARVDGAWRCTAMHVVWDLVGTLTAHIQPGVS
jgi:ketosteroid isomerase-like protein